MDICQGGKLSKTLESRQRWVSGPGTCAGPSHRCHDPSYKERPVGKTHGNRTNRPHMSTPPILLSLGILSFGLSFVAHNSISRTSKVLRGAKHPPFWEWHAQNSCRVLVCESLHRAETPQKGDLSVMDPGSLGASPPPPRITGSSRQSPRSNTAGGSKPT